MFPVRNLLPRAKSPYGSARAQYVCKVPLQIEHRKRWLTLKYFSQYYPILQTIKQYIVCELRIKSSGWWGIIWRCKTWEKFIFLVLEIKLVINLHAGSRGSEAWEEGKYINKTYDWVSHRIIRRHTNQCWVKQSVLLGTATAIVPITQMPKISSIQISIKKEEDIIRLVK